MSSTSNAQNLLVNVFRPTYTYQAGVGYTPSLVVSNVDKVVADTVVASNLVINDPGSNVYVGCNAGNPASNVRASSNNVAVGYNAGNGFSNTSNTVALGYNALGGSLSNVSNTVALGANTIGGGVNNILIGHDTGTVGSNNILIGPDQTPGNISNQLRVGLGSKTAIAADLSTAYVGINTVAPVAPLDVSGQAYFRNKVGIQIDAPTKSLEVNGQTYSTLGFLAGRGTVGNPAYAFYADGSTGLYSPGNGYETLVANGLPYITVGGSIINFHNRTIVNADISGGGGVGGSITLTNGFYRDLSSDDSVLTDISEGNVYAVGNVIANNLIYSGAISNTNTNTCNVIGGVVLSNGDVSANTYNGPGGTANAPHYTFSADRTTGLFFPGPNMIGWTAGGVERVRISNANVGIGTTAPEHALDVCNGTIRAGEFRALSLPTGFGALKLQGGSLENTMFIQDVCTTTLVPTNTTMGGWFLGSKTNLYGAVPETLKLWRFSNNVSAAAPAVAVTAAGNVGIGTSNPTSVLTVVGDVSNSGTHTASNFLGTNTASNLLGGVTLSNFDVSMGGAGRILGQTNVSNVIGGVLLSNSAISNSGTITTGTGSNSIGGVTLSNTNLTLAGTITGSTANTSNVIGGVVLSNNAISNSGTHTASNFIGTSAASNQIGGVTLSNTNLTFAGTITGSTANTSNAIGGVVLSNSNATASRVFLGAGTTLAPSLAFSDSSNLGINYIDTDEFAFVSANAERCRVNQFGLYNDGTTSNTIGGVVLTGSNITTGSGSNSIGSITLNGGRIQATGVATPSAPAYTFLTDSTIGMYLAGTNTLGFATAGTQRMVISNANVGIGTSAPAYTLDVCSGTVRAGELRLLSLPTGYGALKLQGGGLENSMFIQDVCSTNVVPANAEMGGWFLGSKTNLYGAVPETLKLWRFSNNASAAAPAVAVTLAGNVGLGMSNPTYQLDVNGAAGSASVNMSTWARFPVSNTLMAVASNTLLGGVNGGCFNFSDPVQSIDSNLMVFTPSNASVGNSFVIKKGGIWSLQFLFFTGAGQYAFFDVSTGNVASNALGSNGATVLSFVGQANGSFYMLSYTGYLPSNDNYIYKVRGSSNLTTQGTISNRLTFTFLGETPNSAATFPF